MAESSKKTSSQKVKRHQKAKPYPEFPLTAHPSGRWCKKHRGKQFYFGPVDDWQNALERYKREWPYIIDGMGQPSPDEFLAEDGYTLTELCNEFLNAKRSRMDSGEITSRTFKDAHATCGQLIDYLGRDRCVEKLRPTDFEKLREKLAARYSTLNMRSVINQYRGVFRFAKLRRKIEVDFGDSFSPPSAKPIRIARNKTRKADGPRMFEAGEVQTILDNCDTVLRAMVLLGLNCGFGNSDVAKLLKRIEIDRPGLNFYGLRHVFQTISGNANRRRKLPRL